MEMVRTKGKKDAMQPLLLKMGLTFALSVTGFLYSHLRNKMIRHTPRHPSRMGELEEGKRPDEELGVIPSAPECMKEIKRESSRKAIDAAALGSSPASSSSFDGEALLLPEFSELIQQEFEDGCSSKSDNRAVPSLVMINREGMETGRAEEEMRKMEKESTRLQSMVQVLQDKVRKLESQLFESYGLREQDALVGELQNRLKVNAMETQLYTLKIKSLQDENSKLKDQVSDYSKNVAEVESSRAKIKQLKSKMKSDAEQARKKLCSLHQEVTALHNQAYSIAANNPEIQKKLQMVKDFEDELVDLRKENSKLQSENSGLASKLGTVMIKASALENLKVQKMEETNHLREANENLRKEIERIQTDRCAEIEELVYLRWVNACLRYELRNFQPDLGKSLSRVLSQASSPESEEKMKQLILKYGSSGFQENALDLMDFDFDGSSSLGSTITESEADDTPLDVSSAVRNCSLNKTSFTSKLKRLILRKDKRSNRVASVDKTLTSCATSIKPASIGSSI